MATVASGLVVLMLAVAVPMICGKRSVEEDIAVVQDNGGIEVNVKVNAHHQGHSHLSMGVQGVQPEGKTEQGSEEKKQNYTTLTQEEVKKMMFDDEGKKFNVSGGHEMESVGDGLFIRFQIKNCLGRWVVDGKPNQPLMSKAKPGEDPVCSEQLQTAVKDMQSDDACQAEWESDDCKEALKKHKVDQKNLKEFFFIPRDFTNQWNNTQDKPICEGDAEMHKYKNTMFYKMLWPTQKAVEEGVHLGCPTSDERTDIYFPFKFGYPDCVGKKDCKILKGMVLVIGGSKADDVVAFDAKSEEWQKKYAECSKDQKELIDALDSSSAWMVGNFVIALFFAAAGQLLL